VKEKGFTLQGAKEHLKTSKTTTDSNAETIESLNKIKAFLLDLRDTL
jgi:hypothetical protein